MSTLHDDPALAPTADLKKVVLGRKALGCISVNTPSRSSSSSMKKKQISESGCNADEEATVVTTRSSIEEKEQVNASRPLFRVPSLVYEDFEDMLSLKRANPVYDEDDEEYPLSKRQRIMEERDDQEDAAQLDSELMLCWGDRLVVDSEEEGYVLLLQQH